MTNGEAVATVSKPAVSSHKRSKKRRSRAIRPYHNRDETAVVRIWHRSTKAAHTYQPLWQAMTVKLATLLFRIDIRSTCDLWVGTDEERIVAFLAMEESYIHSMYVDPDKWRQGWGKRLLSHAKNLSPQGLKFHTHPENLVVRRWCEKRGFHKVSESACCLEYHWRPETCSP